VGKKGTGGEGNLLKGSGVTIKKKEGGRKSLGKAAEKDTEGWGEGYTSIGLLLKCH